VTQQIYWQNLNQFTTNTLNYVQPSYKADVSATGVTYWNLSGGYKRVICHMGTQHIESAPQINRKNSGEN